MKKGFMVLFPLFVLATGLSGWAQCPEQPNDRGVCDTMYVEPWYPDLAMQGPGPYLVRVPIYVTTDVADEWDSIPAFVIPLCYTSSNPNANAVIDPYWNNTNLYPSPTDSSIFRHFIEGADTLVYNRMMSLSQRPSYEEWDTRILDLVDSHFWLALFAMGSEDHWWWEGSRVLLATQTFLLEDSTHIRIDTCFWPPSNRLTFVTFPPGGGPAINKIPRPGTGNPYSFEISFDFGPEVVLPDCDRSFSDHCLVACPLGDIPFKVYLRDSGGRPLPGYSSVWLDFSGCSGIIPCATETAWPIVHPDGPSDSDGALTFHVNAGGCDNACLVSVMAQACGRIGYVGVKTVDSDGNHFVGTSDWHHIGVDPCNDYNCSGEINYWDLEFFREHILHSCDIDPCLLLSPDLTASPDTLLPVDSTHRVRLFVKNNNAAPCTAQFVKFYRAGFGQGPSLFQFATNYLWQELMPGDTVVTEADFLIPGPGSGYILTKLFSNCCDHSVDAAFNFTQRICPPDSMRYVFPLNLDVVPAYVETLDYMPDTLGWYWVLYETGGMPDSVAIVTPDTSVLGVTGGVTLYFFEQDWSLLGYRVCEVRITLNSGDVNADCVVGAGDIVYLINYLYRSQSPPDPLRAGDVNCDCTVGAGDVVYLINYLFRAGPPPLSSETCECGYKEWFPR